MQIQEEDYFCQVTYRTWDTILHDIREAHKDDTGSAPDGSNALNLIKDAKKALSVPGSYLDVFTALMCTQLQIRYEKLSEQERTIRLPATLSWLDVFDRHHVWIALSV